MMLKHSVRILLPDAPGCAENSSRIWLSSGTQPAKDAKLDDRVRSLRLSETKDIYKHYRGLRLGEEFMRQQPNYPVVKLRVAPGEAYIAPTENIIRPPAKVSSDRLL